MKNSKGISPRSNYLKVVGDFAKWNGKLVLGCDDSAQKEFLNHRPFKSTKASPAQSNSNLWFVDPAQLDELGPVIGRGSVWLKEDVAAVSVSDPYLFTGYDYRTMVITHKTGQPVNFTFEIDKDGTNEWTQLETFTVDKSLIHLFPKEVQAIWIRVKTDVAAKELSVHFNYRNKDTRSYENDEMFAPIAKVGTEHKTKGIVKSNRKVLSLADGENYYELNAELELNKVSDKESAALLNAAVQPQGIIKVDAASAIIIEDKKTYRLPKNDAYTGDLGRICREVATERDLFNFHGTFYELPARNAQGFAKIRPIATHNLNIADYGSHFGLMFITGLNDHAAGDTGFFGNLWNGITGQNCATNDRVISTESGDAAVWTGVIDDLWKLGKPRGEGGPWKNSVVKAGKPSDMYLMTGYDKKSVELTSDKDATITLEVDIDGTCLWVEYKSFEMKANATVSHTFPEGFSAYWVRARSNADATATAWFVYK